MEKTIIPKALVERINSGQCVLFLGSGASTESGAPTAKQLAIHLANKFLDGRHQDESLGRIAAYIEQKPGLGRIPLVSELVSLFSDLTPSEGHLKLAKYPWSIICTTNYDDLVEKGYSHSANRTTNKILSSSELAAECNLQQRDSVLLLKLHGCITNPYGKDVPLVVSEDDFINAAKNRVALLRLMELYKYTKTFLFVGYSFNDEDLVKIWNNVMEELGSLSHWAYSIWPCCSIEQRDLWRSRRVELVDCTFSQFFKELEKYGNSVHEDDKYLGEPGLQLVELFLAIHESRKSEASYSNPRRLLKIVEIIGEQLQLSRESIMNLKIAASAHDIGLINIPSEVLGKREPLNINEFNLIKSHPLIGEAILSNVPGLKKVSKIVRWHHERYSGLGYPDGLKSDEIPIEARVLSLALTIDAMASPRPYRYSLSCEEIRIELLRESGEMFDPVVVETCLRFIDRFSL